MKQMTFRTHFVCLLLCLFTLLAQGAAQTVPSTANLFFQTSGRGRAATIGDWYTTSGSASTDRVHRFALEISQAQLDLAGGSVTVTVNDAESAVGGNDEVANLPDPTRFTVCNTVCNPATGPTLAQQTFLSGSLNGATFSYTFTAPGSYQLVSETGAFPILGDSTAGLNDDDNTFTFSLSSTSFPLIVGQYQSSIQQSVQQSFDAYFYVPPGTSGPLQLRNFDIDGNATVSYLRPDGTTASGTVSGNGVWNGSSGSLNSGFDSVAVNGSFGWWTLQVGNMSGNNQGIFEANDGAGNRLPLVFQDVVNLSLSKTVDDATPDYGDTVTFTVTLSNSGPSGATGLELVDLLPSGLTYQSHSISSPSPSSYNPTTGLWTLDYLAATGSNTATLSVTAQVDSTTPVTNTVRVTKADQPVTMASASASVDPLAADLSLTKTVNNPAPQEGASLSYTLSVTNNGPDAATGVVVSDSLPSGLTFTGSSGCTEDPNGVPSCTLGSLAAGASASFTIQATVNGGTAGSTLTNSASVSATTPDPVSANNTDSASVQVSTNTGPAPALSISKASDAGGSTGSGETITYTIGVSNTGNVPISGIEVTDSLPAGTSYVPSSTQVSAPPLASETVRDEFTNTTYTGDNGSQNWTNSWQETGESDGAGGGEIRVRGDGRCANDNCIRFKGKGDELNGLALSRTANLSGSASASVSFDYRIRDGRTFNGSALVQARSAGGSWATLDSYSLNEDPGVLNSVSYDVSSFISNATELRFLIVSSGNDDDGEIYIDNVQIAYAVPTGGGNVTTSGGPPPTLASGYYLDVGQSLTVTFQVTVDSPASVSQIQNTASVSSDQTPSQNSNTVTDQVVIRADLALAKMVDRPSPAEGDTVVFTVGLENLGGDGATGVTVTDLLPVGLTFLSANPSQGSYNSASGIWDVGALAAGSGATLTLSASVNGGTGGTTLTNTATVSASDQTDPESANNAASASVFVRGATGTFTNICYLVADNGPSGGDFLTLVDRPTGAETDIGETGTSLIEAIAHWPGTNTLYAANGGTLGTLSLSSGTFSSLGAVGGGYSDIDALSFDPFTGELYGVHRRAGVDDLMIKIDPATGGFIPNAFDTNGDGVGDADAVVVSSSAAVGLPDIDDIAIDPYDGTLYAIANSGGGGDTLVKIDKNTGAVTVVGPTTVDDIEGLSFYNDGSLFGTDGNGTGNGDLFDVSKASGAATNPRRLDYGDYEAAACLTAPVNTISGQVFFDQNGDQNLNGSDSGTGDVSVRLYRDVNGNGQRDAGEPLLATVPTAADGSYSFELAAFGAFVLEIDTGDLPADAYLTTDNLEAADFGGSGGLSSTGHDFAWTFAADLAISKTAPATVTAGETFSYSIVVTNLGDSNAANVTVSDALPSGLSFVSATVSGGDGSESCSETGGTVTCNLGTVTTSSPETISLSVTPDASMADGAALSNTATVTSDTFDPVSGNNSSTATTTVERRADLAIEKTVSSAGPEAGDIILYTITVSNLGPSDASGVVVTDNVPSDLLVIQTSGCAEDPNGVPSCSLGTIAAGSSQAFTIEAQVLDTPLGTTITNSASVSANETDPVTGNDSDSVDATVSGLTLNKTVRNVTQGGAFGTSVTGEPGDVLEYRIDYSRSGIPIFDTVLRDIVPSNTTFETDAFSGNADLFLRCPDGSDVLLETGVLTEVALDLASECSLSTATRPDSSTDEALLDGEGGYILFRVRIR